MRVLVTGDRFYDDPDIVQATLTGFLTQYVRKLFDRGLFLDEFVVVEGQCPKGGADQFAADWAKSTPDVAHDPHPANWKKYGKAAGPIRNQEMLDTNPDVGIAFHDDLEQSKGTKDMVERAAKRGIPVYHIRRVGNPKLF